MSLIIISFAFITRLRVLKDGSQCHCQDTNIRIVINTEINIQELRIKVTPLLISLVPYPTFEW